MADRYWVGGTGTWDFSNTANWSATSGGAGGASVPTSLDNVFIDSNSGPANLVITTGVGYTARCYTFSMTRGVLQPTYNTDLVVGDFSGGTNSGNFSITGGYAWYFRYIQIYGSTTGTPSTFNVPSSLTSTLGGIEFMAGSVQLTANFQTAAGSNIFRIKSGATLDISGRTVTVSGTFEVESSGTLLSSSSTLTTSTFTLNSGAIFNPSGISLLSVGSQFTDQTSRTYPSVAFTGTVTVDVPASVTFTTLQLAGMLVKAGQTVYVGTLTSVSSTVRSLSTSNSPGQFTLSSPSGTKTLPFLAISNCNATGGATWVAPSSSSDMGNNTGIQFANSRGLLAIFT